jgi:hypothetical protein
MGFAPYFDKNASAAQALLPNLGKDALKAVLHNELVMIAFDASAAATEEGIAILDLVIRIVARLYPNIVICALGKGQSKRVTSFEALAKSINPNLTTSDQPCGATRAIVVGGTALTGTFKRLNFTAYVGSDNWLAKVSMKRPVGVGESQNPFGAGLAACIATANLFRAVFANQLGAAKLDEELVYSAWRVEPAKARSANPTFKDFDIGSVHLVGAGAIGNGFLWALSRTLAWGELHIVDDETVDNTNLQRYVMCVADDENSAKVRVAARVFVDRKAHIKICTHQHTWESFVEGEQDRRFDKVVTALDSGEARVRVQASLPKRILNGWTQHGEAGVSRHGFDDEFACLACLYTPKHSKPHLDEMILQGLCVPRDDAFLKEIRKRIQLQTPNDPAFLEDLARRSGHAVDRLLAYSGQTLGELYQQAVCSGKLLAFKRGEVVASAEVPMPFQSALAGLLLAAELVPKRPRLPTITQFDLLRPAPDAPSHPHRKSGTGKCICEDTDFRAVYREKYSSPATS